jgi:hypothetical protein
VGGQWHPGRLGRRGGQIYRVAVGGRRSAGARAEEIGALSSKGRICNEQRAVSASWRRGGGSSGLLRSGGTIEGEEEGAEKGERIAGASTQGFPASAVDDRGRCAAPPPQLYGGWLHQSNSATIGIRRERGATLHLFIIIFVCLRIILCCVSSIYCAFGILIALGAGRV